MLCRLVFLFIIAGQAFLRASDESAGEFRLLQIGKQSAMPLPFFLRHSPVAAVTNPAEPARFGPLPDGVSAQLAEVGHLAGRHLFSVRYLTDSRLVRGNAGAIGLVLLCRIESDPLRFAPLVVAWGEDEGVVDDFSVSSVRQAGALSFIWVRRDYSGTANTIGRMAISAADSSSPLSAYAIFADSNPLDEFAKQGWECWHRGNYFDEETLTWHFHLYRDPAKASAKDEGSHRHVRVRYTFRAGKLHPEKPEDDENGT